MDANIEVGELVIGLVGPVGTDLDKVLTTMCQHLKERYRFEAEVHRLSEFFAFEELRSVVPDIPRIDTSSEYARIKSAMDAGDRLREHTENDDIMALYAAARVHQLRSATSEEPKPLPRTAHLLRSLKRPEEVVKLRNIYGSRFLLVSVFSSRQDRLRHLEDDKGMKPEQAQELVLRDDAGGPHGQATAKTFDLADLFLDGGAARSTIEHELRRFFDLVFGSPLVTPTAREHGMFAAFSASLRSGDLSRQVGAVVTTRGGTVVSEGVNDAPCFGGEPYWPGESDQRDIVLEHDANEKIKRQIAERILREFDALPEGADPLEVAKKRLGESGLLDITEYGRAVHAEMAALMNCARLGTPTTGRILYCTTFPCHNCAKHIVAAGIEQVFFIEPYPKSRALELHTDSLALGEAREKVEFHPFVGIGPRRYVELFSLRDTLGSKISRKSKTGRITEWSAPDAALVVPDRLANYLEMEHWAAAQLTSIVNLGPGDGPAST